MNFSNDLLFLRYLIRSVLFIPFDPISPQLNDLFLFKISSNAESSGGMNIGVELFFFDKVLMLFSEYFDHVLLVGLYLCKLAVGNEKGIGVGSLLHCCSIIF